MRTSNDCRILGQPNTHHGASRAQKSRCLLVSSLGSRKDDHAMRTIRCDLHDLSWDIGCGREVNEGFGTELHAELAFCFATINGNHTHPHGLRVLNAKVTKAATH